MTMTVLLPSRIENLWATRKRRLSKLNHTAHSLARLRIAGRSVAPDVARRATGLPCSAVTGRDLHPLDNDSAFPKMTATSFPADQPCLVAPQSVLSVPVLTPKTPCGVIERPSPFWNDFNYACVS